MNFILYSVVTAGWCLPKSFFIFFFLVFILFKFSSIKQDPFDDRGYPVYIFVIIIVHSSDEGSPYEGGIVTIWSCENSAATLHPSSGVGSFPL